MYKVLIIDDEEPLREAIRILGDWKGLGVEEVLEATDGKIGLAMLAEQRIDLAMVDMKMPELNGMELLQIIERDYPELLTIVISGYNDFEYTRQAIRSKVVDYLLKPVNRIDLNQSLRKAVDLLDAKRKKDSEFINRNITLNMSLPRLKEKIYQSIIERSFKSKTNEAFLPLIGADDPGNRFTVAVFRILNLEQVRKRRFHEDTDLLHFAAANVINEIAGDHFGAFSFASPKQEREMISILTMKGGYPEDIAYRSIHQMNKVAATLGDLFGLIVVAGIGPSSADAMDIASSYEAAKGAIGGIDLLKLKSGAVLAGVDKTHAPAAKDNPSLTSRMMMIRSALESGSIQNAKTVLGDFVKKWRASDGFSLGDADRTIHEFIILLNDMALELGVQQERLPMGGLSGLRAIGLSTDFAAMDAFDKLLCDILDYYSAEMRKSQTVNQPFDVGDIKSYIDNHYFEDIKISMFAEKYFLSREYLMKLFKQQFGYGIHEYVQKVRMDKAKELLDDPGLKIQDISEMLGYKDKNYFSKAFRNYYSVSPTEYRAGSSNG
ncbi:response regulator [Paenibacillus alkaliterrae]|uniref:response regulator transcription factor n=1 Tax=Paenibacillus alkaliterrae TaxID=320909 RepID=UPI001F1B2B47|nr:helix-turn-helix domain-containing protein [Paenibacillus alkaliterrae]MCF2938110.1 response regulator [Paenibacillus alkaliterrae]